MSGALKGSGGLIAKFGSTAELVAAIERLQETGYRKLDTFTPFPIPAVSEALCPRTAAIGWIAALAALAGGAFTWATVYWTSVIDYPLDIGGRPLDSWPAFLPVIIVAAALWSGIATLIGMLWLCGLPRWHDPLFDVRQFGRATYDKFFLFVARADPAFSEEEARRLLDSFGCEQIDTVAP